MTLLVVLAAAVGAGLTLTRWLRVAQREHYEPGRVLDLSRVWVAKAPGQALLYASAVVLVVSAVVLAATGADALAAVVALGAVVAGGLWPRGLSWRGKGKPFALTARARRLTGVVTVLLLLDLLLAVLLRDTALGLGVAAALPLLVPGAVELGLLATKPVEARLARRWVVEAEKQLSRVRPTVVALTGSYGKTSTKNYVGHLVSPTKPTVVSPASFNNLLGLARAVNDRLTPGTEVFVAEMGTYGPGEIARLCALFPPDVAAMTAIGDVHLERFGSRDAIVRAKREITVRASTVVLNVDSPELAALVEPLLAEGKRVLRAGTGRDATLDVAVRGRTVVLAGEPIGDLPEGSDAHPTNVAVAVGIGYALGVPASALARGLGSLPAVAHRREVTRVDGVAVVDDTYNANPDGARAALDLAEASRGPGGRLVVVTPGMIELGPEQAVANAAFAEDAARRGATLIVVGHVNRRALLAGVRRADSGEVRTVADRVAAVELVATLTAPGDAVLYENDLPDHYP